MFRYRYLFFGLSSALAIMGLGAVVLVGLPLSNEFTGGSLLEVTFERERPPAPQVEAVLTELDLGRIAIEPKGARTFVIRFRPVDEALHRTLVGKLASLASGELQEERFDVTGPTLGRELRRKSMWAMVITLAGIFLYLVIAFRQRRGSISVWRYATVGVGTLFHDVLITVGLMSIAAAFLQLEFRADFIAALLAVAGYSINDTIVIYDRIRETLGRSRGEPTRGAPSGLVWEIQNAVRSTLRRSIFTSFTTLLALVAILFFGGETLRAFALTVIVGIIIGTYSSLCIASTLLVPFRAQLRRG